MVVARREQAVDAVAENRRDAAGVGRDDRAAAREGFEHRGRHVVDVRGLQIDIGFGVVAPDFVGRHAAGKRHMGER